ADRGGRLGIVGKAAAPGIAATIFADGLVGDESGIGNGERRSISIADARAHGQSADSAENRITEGYVAGKHVVGQHQAAAAVQDAAAPIVPSDPSMRNHQAGDSSRDTLVDIEDPADIISTDCQQACAGALNVN